ADGVITALSNFARMPLPNLHPFSIEQCLKESLELNPVPKEIRVTIDCQPPAASGLGDIDQLRIVFGNLIRNAREAMPEGGDLSIGVRQTGDKLKIEVADTGVGISADNLSRITEPLFSTKARGLGLGLAIVRTILDKNNGCLSVTSAPGQGTKCTVLL